MSFFAIYYAVLVIFMMIFFFASGGLGSLSIDDMSSISSAAQEIESDILESLPLGWLSIITLFLGSFIYLIVRGKRMFTIDLTKTSSKIHVPDFFKMAGIILGINAIVTLISYLLLLFFESMGFESGADPIEMLLQDYSGILYVVLLGPILEEIIFRGAVLRSLERFGQNFAIVVSSLLFGLYHQALFQGIFAFFVGLVLGYCALRFSIKWAMALHVINNGFAVSLSYVPGDDLIAIGILLLVLALGVLSAFFAFNTFRRQLKTGKPTELHFAAGMPIVPYYISPADPRITPYIAPAMMLRAKPYHLLFSSPVFIVALSLISVSTLVMTFAF